MAEVKGYIAINGILVSTILAMVACIVADFFAVNLPHSVGSHVRFQVQMTASDARAWSER